ncbi:hypothetical protein QR680_018108 [Steinernema hermaphroditum]|uniref:Uncharacterized protein n=1 Tax=Steinernema hermaphroditum TaxID=289476 RepID=A0AA39HHV2_9BILA|nr:hypothetical protein QR680_018108 [Steinernema hermaphroditum]
MGKRKLDFVDDSDEDELRELTKNEQFQWRLNYTKELGAYTKNQIVDAIEDVPYEEKRSNRQVMMLPDDGGIYTKEGFPFHHVVSNDLKPHHIARLAKHGIRLRSGALNRAEQAIVMENWKKFSSEHSIPDADAHSYIGVCGYARDNNERNEERKWLQQVNFLPRMCDGLLDRSGATIGRFLRSRFHPSVVAQEDLLRPWTAEEEEKLKYIIENDPDRNFEELGIEMKRTRKYLFTRKRMILEREEAPEELTIEEQYKLYQRIKPILKPDDPLKVLLAPNWQSALTRKNIKELACLINRKEKVIEQEWLNIGYLMLKTYNEFRDRDDITLRDVEQKAFDLVASFNVEIFRECLTYLLELPVVNSLAQINHARLSKWIASKGLAFATSKPSTGHHVLSVIQKALKDLTEYGYMDRLPLSITIRDLVELLAELVDQKLYKGNLNEHNKKVKKVIKCFSKTLAERARAKETNV